MLDTQPWQIIERIHGAAKRQCPHQALIGALHQALMGAPIDRTIPLYDPPRTPENLLF